MQNQTVKFSESKPTRGYFVALGEQEIASFKKGTTISTSRSGVYYDKVELISTLKDNQALKRSKMSIIEIVVPPNAIVPIASNNKKFGIRSENKILIISIKRFEKALEESKMLAVA